jgi:hypothetical protein
MAKILTSNIIEDIQSNLESSDFIIPKNIKCLETDTSRHKIGNGSDTYIELPYEVDTIPVAPLKLVAGDPPQLLPFRTDPNGKPVYIKLYDCGMGPNKTFKNIPHNITNFDYIKVNEEYSFMDYNNSEIIGGIYGSAIVCSIASTSGNIRDIIHIDFMNNAADLRQYHFYVAVEYSLLDDAPIDYKGVTTLEIPNVELDKEVKLLELQNGKQLYGILKRFIPTTSEFDDTYIYYDTETNLIQDYDADTSSIVIDTGRSYTEWTSSSSFTQRFPIDSSTNTVRNGSNNTFSSFVYTIPQGNNDRIYIRIYRFYPSTLNYIYIYFTYTKVNDPVLSGSLLSLFGIDINNALINRPDIWEPGIEYNFGNNLYGGRFQVTIPDGTGRRIVNLVSNVENIIDSNGIIPFNNVDVYGNINNNVPLTNSTVSSSLWISNNVLFLQVVYGDDRSVKNLKTNFWVKYTKI